MPPSAYHFPSMVGFTMKNSLHSFLFSFLLKCRANFLLFLLLFGQFPAVMGGKVSSPGAVKTFRNCHWTQSFAVILLIHTHTTDSYVPIHIFLNLSAVLEKKPTKVQDMRLKHTIISLFPFSIVL